MLRQGAEAQRVRSMTFFEAASTSSVLAILRQAHYSGPTVAVATMSSGGLPAAFDALSARVAWMDTLTPARVPFKVPTCKQGCKVCRVGKQGCPAAAHACMHRRCCSYRPAGSKQKSFRLPHMLASAHWPCFTAPKDKKPELTSPWPWIADSLTPVRVTNFTGVKVPVHCGCKAMQPNWGSYSVLQERACATKRAASTSVAICRT